MAIQCKGFRCYTVNRFSPAAVDGCSLETWSDIERRNECPAIPINLSILSPWSSLRERACRGLTRPASSIRMPTSRHRPYRRSTHRCAPTGSGCRRRCNADAGVSEIRLLLLPAEADVMRLLNKINSIFSSLLSWYLVRAIHYRDSSTPAC